MSTRLPRAFEKHRRAHLRLAVDFSGPLARRVPVQLTGIPEVVVTQRTAAGGWADKSAEFGVGTEAIIGELVTFELLSATAGEQDGGEYRVRVTVATTGGETLVSTHPLHVLEDADEEAPVG